MSNTISISLLDHRSIFTQVSRAAYRYVSTTSESTETAAQCYHLQRQSPRGVL